MRLLYDKKLTDFYDDIVLSGYYDYGKEIQVIKNIVGRRRTLLELGSGTGNLLVPLAREGFEVTGIDNSPHMVRVLREKQSKEGLDFPNFQADQRNFDLDKKFDVVVSSGGFVWFSVFDNKIFIQTYDPSFRGIVQTFQSAYKHLNDNGLLLINIQHHGEEFGLKMRNGMNYRFEIKWLSPTRVVKTHHIEEGGVIVFQRAFPQRVFSEQKAVQAAKETGFKVLGPDNTEAFYVFETS